ncbi:MAG: hypothetical protein U1E66_11975 [Rhodospirillales bacterium]
MDVTSLAQQAVALRSAAASQQINLAAVKQAHQADQAVVDMLAQAMPSAPTSSSRGQNLNIVV